MAPLPAGTSIRQLQPIMLRICPLDCAAGGYTRPCLQKARRNRRLGLALSKPCAAMAVSARRSGSGSPVISASMGRSNSSKGTTAEKGLPDSPSKRAFPRTANNVGIPGFISMP